MGKDDCSTSNDESKINISDLFLTFFSVSSVNRLIVSKNYSIFDYQCKANTVFPLIFEYLNFFDFINLYHEDLKEFQELCEAHLMHKYFNEKRRSKLFKNFNLEYFLYNVDRKSNTVLPQIHLKHKYLNVKYLNRTQNILKRPKKITMKQLNFILEIAGFLMKSISLETKYLYEVNFSNYTNDVCQVMKGFIKYINLDFITIDGKAYALGLDILFKNSPIINLQRDISANELQSLTKNKLVYSLSVFTDYSAPNNLDLIMKYLRCVQIRELYVKGTSGSLIENCDEILKAVEVNNTQTIKSIRIENSHSYNLLRLLSKFKNLNEIILDNINYIGHHIESSDIDLSMIGRLTIKNCSIIDDSALYQLLTNYFPSLESMIISNCENVNGSFLHEIKRTSGNCLKVDLTYLNKEFAPKINAKSIPNQVIYSACNYAPYGEELIHNAIASFEETSVYNYEHMKSTMPHGFSNVLKRYYRSGNKFYLNLANFTNMDENCLNYILKSLPLIQIISLNTHYPRIRNEKLCEFLKEILTLNEVRICGYKYADIMDERSCCNHLIKALNQSKSQCIAVIEITGCSMGKSKIYLSRVTEVQINNNPEINDEMCIDLISSCYELKKFHLSGCNNVTGSFLHRIHKIKDFSIHIVDAPRIFTFIKEATDIPELTANIKLCINLIGTAINSMTPRSYDKEFEITCFDEKFFKNLVKFHHISELSMSSFYSNVHYWNCLRHLKVRDLLLINGKFHERDDTVEILKVFADSKENCLVSLTLKMCKIDERAIKLINNLGGLCFLSFETIRGLTKEIIKKITVRNRITFSLTLEIIDNEELDDDTCFEIIENLNAEIVNVSKCPKITENLIDKINSGDRGTWLKQLNISGTDVGYHQLWNSIFLIHPWKKLLNFSRGANFDYLRKIFKKEQTNHESITKLPEMLIKTFSGQETLDLRDLTDLTDLAFELVSQLCELETLKIRSNYVNVKDRRSISSSLLKMNLQTLLVQGCESGNDSLNDILEPFCYITNSLQEIILVDCLISRDLLESLCCFNEFYVFQVSNKETILHR